MSRDDQSRSHDGWIRQNGECGSNLLCLCYFHSACCQSVCLRLSCSVLTLCFSVSVVRRQIKFETVTETWLTGNRSYTRCGRPSLVLCCRSASFGAASAAESKQSVWLSCCRRSAPWCCGLVWLINQSSLKHDAGHRHGHSEEQQSVSLCGF